MNKVLVSKKSDIWETPKEIKESFSHCFDPCPINPTFDGLKIDWEEENFVNPPYSQLKKWVKKSIEEAKKGKRVYLLIPARTDTKAFKMIWEYGAHIMFLEGRLRFSDKENAPFPSMLVWLNGRKTYCSLRTKNKGLI